MNLFNRLRIAFFLREEVLEFSEQMEKNLRKNDHKGGWLHWHWDWLWMKFYEEHGELMKACNKESTTRVGEEAADVANVCMFMYDKAHEHGVERR